MAIVSNEYVVDTFNHFLTDLLMGNGRNLRVKKVRKILIQIQIKVQKIQGQYQEHHWDRISQPECKNIITYDLDALMEIKHVTERDNIYKQLPFGTVRTVCELKLNRRKRGSRGGQGRNVVPMTFKKPTGVVRKNLRPLQYASYKVTKHTGKLQLLLMNTQSIRNKEDILSDYVRSEAIDVAIATET